jgi:hypothetical protein
MTEDHRHNPETGEVIAVEQAPEHVAETEVEASAAVEIARLNAERDVQIAKLETKAVDRDLEAELTAALAEIELLKAAKMPVADAESNAETLPAQTVIVADSPAPEAVQDDTEPPIRDDERPARVKHRDGWFGERA